MYETKQPPLPKAENRVSISVNLAVGVPKSQKENINLNQIENSEQKNSLGDGEDDTKYVKTPELNMGEKYSHKCSDNKLSARSTEKEIKKSTRCHSSQKKKSIKVAKEIQECKKDLIKMQKLNEIRKKKNTEENDEDKEVERRKQNLEMLNHMLKKRNEHFKRKKRNQEKLLKKDLHNFEKSMGVSFSKKQKKRKIKFKNIKRNQTFSCLSSKEPCDTMNTSKNELYTEKKQNKQMLELKISIKKDKCSNKQENSSSMIYSPNSKPAFSSQKKKNSGLTTSKKYSAKKCNESIKTNSSSKLKSGTKLGTKSANSSQFINPKRGYTNAYKKKKAIQSESKKNSTIGVNQFNDISEIQEFNMTDEESLINSSILKNIEEHESIHQEEL